jgi:tetratricopeptide (TPR) repeat protein
MTWRWMVFGLAVTIAIPLQTATARAQGTEAARDHFNQGVKHYSRERFDDAIVEFGKAYDIEAAPIFLFNIAQSYRQLGKKDRALFFYRRYLEQKPDAANRPEVEKRIKDLQASLESETKDQPKPAAEPDKPVTAQSAATKPATEAPRVEVVKVADEGQPTEEERAQHRRLRIASIAVGGAGLALGITGVVFRGIATSKIQAAASDNAAGLGYNPANDNYRTFEGAGLALMISGGAALTAGVVGYFYFRDKAPAAEPQVSLRVGPNDLGVVFGRRF